MRVVVLVPWRAGDRCRERSWRFVATRWARSGFELVLGDRPGPFSRSGSRNAAALAAGEWDVAVFADADTFVRDSGPLLEAIERAWLTGRVVVPHDSFLGLSPRGAELVRQGRDAGYGLVQKRRANSPLGLLVVPRTAWTRIGGFDERFSGWGGEDVAFLRAARTLVGVDRIPGEIYHLWHPIDSGKAGYMRRPPVLLAAYRAAEGDPVAMAALVRQDARSGREAEGRVA